MALPYGFGKKEMEVALILLDLGNLISSRSPPIHPNSSSLFFPIPSSWPTTNKRRRNPTRINGSRTNTITPSSSSQSQPQPQAAVAPPPNPSASATRVYFRRSKGNLLRCEKKVNEFNNLKAAEQISPSTSNYLKPSPPQMQQEEAHVMMILSPSTHEKKKSRSSAAAGDQDQEKTPDNVNTAASHSIYYGQNRQPQSESDYNSISGGKRAKNLESKHIISAISPLLSY